MPGAGTEEEESHMGKRLSRRSLLGLGASSVAAGLGWRREATARAQDQPTAGPKSSAGRPYWEKTYSGGSPDVAPLAPGQPGADYTPVTVPNGAALPFTVVDGVKVLH